MGNEPNEPIDPMNVPMIFFDGFTDIKIIDGVARAALLEKRDGETIIAARIACPVSKLPDLIQDLTIALITAAKAIVTPGLNS